MACLASCNTVYTSCAAGFNSLGATYSGESNSWGGSSYSNPGDVCESTRATCAANCMATGGGYGGGSGGGGGGSSFPALTEEQEAWQKMCDETLSAVNSDGDSKITNDEYLNHVDLVASKLCPGTLRPVSYNDEFNGLSCIMCAGIADPNNPFAHDGFCPCVDGVTPAGPIDFDPAVSSQLEAYFYCAMVRDFAAISCGQPDRACYDECYSGLGECNQKSCDKDAVIDCILDCQTPFHQCLGTCLLSTATVGADGGAGNDGGGTGQDSAPSLANSAGGAQAGASKVEDGEATAGGDGALDGASGVETGEGTTSKSGGDTTSGEEVLSSAPSTSMWMGPSRRRILGALSVATLVYL